MQDSMRSFSSNVHPVMEENETFLKSESAVALNESIELTNDAIDYAVLLAKEEDPEKFASIFYFYVNHVLMPTSYSIPINLLVGNLPSCFRDLRFLVEFLAKAYLADDRYTDKDFFRDRLLALSEEKTNKGTRYKREIDFVKEFDTKMGFTEQVVEQWQKFSKEIHAARYMERVVENVIEKDNVPGYSLVFPIAYTKKDVPELLELGRDIEWLGSILKEIFQRYNNVTS